MPQFVALVPVKPPAQGKSRLVGVPDETRRELAEAFALDTVGACLGAATVTRVLVATDDAAFSVRLTGLGAEAIPDGAAQDLNETLRQCAAEARRRWPDLVPVAVCADLPALLSADLDAGLDEAADALATGSRAYVPDAAGVGTTLYAAPHDDFDPRFGLGSAAAHDAGGARPVGVRLSRLRRDVDDLEDLRDAVRLGVGAHTAGVGATALGADPGGGPGQSTGTGWSTGTGTGVTSG